MTKIELLDRPFLSRVYVWWGMSEATTIVYPSAQFYLVRHYTISVLTFDLFDLGRDKFRTMFFVSFDC